MWTMFDLTRLVLEAFISTRLLMNQKLIDTLQAHTESS